MQGGGKVPRRKRNIDFTSRKIGAMARRPAWAQVGGPCIIYQTIEERREALSGLLTQAQIIERERRDSRLHELAESEDSATPKVTGFGSLSVLEAEQKRISDELEAKRNELATRQKQLERAILQHETLKENIQTGDAMHADFSAMLETGIDEFLEANVSKTPESATRVLRGLNEMAPRQLFVERWPNVKKSIQSKVKKLDGEIKSMMKEKGNTNV